MNEYRIKAYAKINLGLDVVRRLENGYHEVKMVMQTVGIYDVLDFQRTAGGIVITTDSGELPTNEDNLIYKAAKLMKDTFKIDGGFKIHLTKNIPAAAGLAGGSSDCAATLIGINELCGLGFDIEKLCEIGVKLGADVPFCIRKGTMLAEGIGEILTPLTPLTGIPVLLIKPNISISTPYVYKHLKLNKLDYHPDNKAVISYIKDNNIKKIAASLSNVLETVTIPENPIIAELKRYLTESGAIGSLMSGSGPTTFGIFENMETAKKAYEKAKADYPDFDVVLCQTM